MLGGHPFPTPQAGCPPTATGVETLGRHAHTDRAHHAPAPCNPAAISTCTSIPLGTSRITRPDDVTERRVMTGRRKEMTPLTTRLAPVSGAGAAAGAVGGLDHGNSTIIPFRVRRKPARRTSHFRHPRSAEQPTADLDARAEAVPIAPIIPRQRAKVAGRVRSIQVQPRYGIPTLELTIIPNAGDSLVVVFFGRRRIAGVQPGARVCVWKEWSALAPADSRCSTPSMRSSTAHQQQTDRSPSQAILVAKSDMQTARVIDVRPSVGQIGELRLSAAKRRWASYPVILLAYFGGAASR